MLVISNIKWLLVHEWIVNQAYLPVLLSTVYLTEHEVLCAALSIVVGGAVAREDRDQYMKYMTEDREWKNKLPVQFTYLTTPPTAYCSWNPV